jgi:flagellar motor switch protein FliN/FliY
MDNQATERETLDAILKKVQSGPAPQAVSGSLPGAGPAGTSTVKAFEDVESLGDGVDGETRRPRSELLKGIHLKVRAELGRARLPLKDALQLAPGSVVDLEKLADDPVDLYVNDLLIARGEVLVMNDCFCIRITEVFTPGGVEGEG